MEIIIYTTLGCGHCTKIKELMDRANVEYTALLVGKDISREEFKIKYPCAPGFPYTIIDDKIVGGIIETIKLFVEMGLVSSRKK